ncbi:hypothetical protein KSP40_PGU016909 [Platanthera guangdongensis]|uniref:Uncharacterized protein n=1 Tax=Platanthera guangdongensis TaxID=2320717 RepID=A0ABR2MAL6_9ASPA
MAKRGARVAERVILGGLTKPARTRSLVSITKEGVRKATPGLKSFFSSRHGRAVGIHIEFVTGVVDGKVSVGCDATTRRAYASCLVGLMVRYAPTWIPAIGKGTVRKLAAGLRGWQEWDLALALLERGGLGSVELVVESLR